MSKFSDLIVRSLSGVVLVAILLGATYYSIQSQFVILAVIALGAHRELTTTLCPSSIKLNLTISKILASVFIVTVALYRLYEVSYMWIWVVSILILTFRVIVEIAKKRDNSLHAIVYDIFAVIYGVVPMMMLSTLPSWITISFFILIWSNDVGAYLIGVAFGRHKLCEHLSPKKSWEGFWGGVTATLIVAYVISLYYPFSMQYNNTVMWLIVGFIVAILGVYGDLFESMLKRSAGVKDSGSAIPGHGGFLDRFDAMLLAAPVIWIIYNFINI